MLPLLTLRCSNSQMHCTIDVSILSFHTNRLIKTHCPAYCQGIRDKDAIFLVSVIMSILPLAAGAGPRYNFPSVSSLAMTWTNSTGFSSACLPSQTNEDTTRYSIDGSTLSPIVEWKHVQSSGLARMAPTFALNVPVILRVTWLQSHLCDSGASFLMRYL